MLAADPAVNQTNLTQFQKYVGAALQECTQRTAQIPIALELRPSEAIPTFPSAPSDFAGAYYSNYPDRSEFDRLEHIRQGPIPRPLCL